jgi:hypothetical protein
MVTNNFLKKSLTQPMRSLDKYVGRPSFFFSFGFGEGQEEEEERDLLSFFSSSQCVLIEFSKGSLYVPKCFPNSTTLLSHKLWPKSNFFRIYKLYKGGQRGSTFVLLLLGGVPGGCLKENCDGAIKMAS